MELIVFAVLTIAVEIFVLEVFDRRSRKRWEGDKKESISEESFWQNIISYDHRKGGEKK